ncbi:conserved hypothetical protein [Beutenbergia cavernae DSM 12333]|uniref:Anti-sigma K factor RskA C-terminal domain-containing protein n=1 Tax=Beutenbergia cavernae (strain ATCC BAA-8 / DSM 12333 / CCUG 43141 / JCM 11478 / NBRC 16432 / NCIMB 13614 / HKI 0122) TaxID=471853 RepID=C5C287_BEUC1|nr:anti-sigma factor [Beutenbergia cavernae]ACQ81712.1 conserved hypothetical protein [Beutenbergia cavernae DSM 12333]
MSHPDREDLSAWAVDGTMPDDAHLHVDSCDECQEELAALRRIAEAGRMRSGELATPAPHVWDRIAAELALSAPSAQPDGAAPPPTTGRPDGDGGDPAAETRPRAWWRRPTAWIAAAAFAVGAIGAVLVERALRPGPAEIIATAELVPLPGWDDAGRADLEVEGQGRVLAVDLATAPDEGYREVWLISSDLERLISLGVLTGTTGRFDIPDGIDLDDFAIVDVSAEPLDGDPAHSGDSIARGELT